MKQIDKSWITALTYGDGHIRKDRNSLEIRHHAKNLDYLQYKANRLSIIKGDTININPVKGQEANCIYFSDPYLKNIRKWVYFNNDKRPQKWLLDRFSNEDVLCLYLDDGSLVAKKQKGKIHAWDLTISTYFPFEKDAQLLANFLKERYDASFTIKRSKGRFSVRCGTKAARKFLSILHPLNVCSSMEYKFRLL